jgi:hypothetical protein
MLIQYLDSLQLKRKFKDEVRRKSRDVNRTPFYALRQTDMTHRHGTPTSLSEAANSPQALVKAVLSRPDPAL